MGVNIEDYDLKGLGRRLTHFRESSPIRTMAALSAKSGVAENTILAIEKGRGNPTIETLAALAKTLGIPLIDLLFDRKTEPKPLKPRKIPKASGEVPDFGQMRDLFEKMAGLRGRRRALVLMLVYDQVSALADDPGLARALEELLKGKPQSL